MDIFCCHLPDTVLAVFLGLCLAFLFLFFNSSFSKQDVRARNLPRGSEGWPLLGETLAFLSPHRSNSLGRFLQDHCSRYDSSSKYASFSSFVFFFFCLSVAGSKKSTVSLRFGKDSDKRGIRTFRFD